MPYLCLGRICSNKVGGPRTLPLPARVQPPLHTNGPPRDNCPGLRTVLPAPTEPPAAPAALPWSTTCAPFLHPCSRPRPRRAPWPNEAAPPHFPALRPFGSTLLLSPDRLSRQIHART